MGKLSILDFAEPVEADQPGQQAMGARSVTSSIATPTAAQSDPISEFAEPVDASADPTTPGVNFVDASQTVSGFADELPPEVASKLSPEQIGRWKSALQPGVTAQQLGDVMHSFGFDLNNADDVAKAVNKGTPLNENFDYKLPDVETNDGAVGAGARGIADTVTMGTVGKLGAAAQAVNDVFQGKGDFGERYDRNLDYQNALESNDERDHPYARIAGQLIGGMALPTGLETVGARAGALAMREAQVAGWTGREALMAGRAAAARAVTQRMTAEGAGYGAAYGAGSADTPGGAVVGAVGGAAAGAAGGAAFGLAGESIAPRLVARAAAARAKPAPTDYSQLAGKLGVEATPATTGGVMAGGTQMAFANAPGSVGMVANAVGKENDSLATAARTTAEAIGPVGNRASAGEDVAKGAADYEKSSKAVSDLNYGQRDALFGGQEAPVPLSETTQAYSDIAAKFPTSPAIAQLNEHPVLRRLLDPATQSQPLTLGEATEALSHIRGVQRNLAKNADASGIVLSRVGKVEQALENDVMEAGRQADVAAGRTPGEAGSAVAAQKNADAFYADRKAALKGTLKIAIAANEDATMQSTESVYNHVVAQMQRDGGNIARLRDTWFRLPDHARSTFAATAVDDMGRAVHGSQDQPGTVWSFNTFMTNYDKQAPQARNIVFGANAGEQLDDIAKYASRLRRLDKMRNFSNTAKNVVLGGVLSTVATALWHGDVASIGELGGAIATSAVGAKVFLSTPAMRVWTRQTLRIGLMSDAKAQESAAHAMTRRLSAIARAEPAIATDVLALQSRLMETFGSSHVKAAADGRTGNEQNR